MDTKELFIIQGLAGKRTLQGTVTINGAKNSALKAMAAAILFDGPVILENVPEMSDIETLANIIRKLGGRVEVKKSERGGRALIVDATGIVSTDIDVGLAKNMRGSVVLTGPLLGRYKNVKFPTPGGCVIGARPINLFISGYEKMWAKVNGRDCVYDISADKGIKGTGITFEKISVGATETLMMAAVLAKGKTVLNNCAREPEIVNVAEWLNECGASISGAGTSTIIIQGTDDKLLSAKKSFITIPDRITTGSYIILGALCAKKLTIENCRPDHLEATTKLLIESGVKMKIGEDFITVYGGGDDETDGTTKNSAYKLISNIRTQEYPGFPTDLQSPMVVFLTQCAGESVVFENIFEGRFKYVDELIKLGADITIADPREILIKGPTLFHCLPDDEELTVHDIRAGFAVVLAALLGEGKSRVTNIYLIDRGYEKLDEVLRSLGAKIKRVQGSTSGPNH